MGPLNGHLLDLIFKFNLLHLLINFQPPLVTSSHFVPQQRHM